MLDLKKIFFKTQLSVWQDHSLTFKIRSQPLKLCVSKKHPIACDLKKPFSVFSNLQFPNDLFSAI
jgi:hypothetical protein